MNFGGSFGTSAFELVEAGLDGRRLRGESEIFSPEGRGGLLRVSVYTPQGRHG